MGIFNDFTISGSGMYVSRRWLDALSDNISNVNTVNPYNQSAYAEEFVQAQAANVDGSGGGVKVASIQHGDDAGTLAYDPSNPNAGPDGYIKRPEESLSDQMTNMILAQRSYQANANAISTAKQAYESALQLGK
jgi:flagellar basal-body rod protein FlgC